jgi:ABC-type sulfate/molybdate transport systems ATPase subunit
MITKKGTKEEGSVGSEDIKKSMSYKEMLSIMNQRYKHLKHITIFDEIAFEIPPMNICSNTKKNKDSKKHIKNINHRK